MAEDGQLRERTSGSDLVVVGKVASIEKVAQVAGQPVSEHQPHWTKGLIQVEAIEKGTLAQNEVEVFFPASRDIVWYNSPKFQVGQKGIWILRKQSIKEMDAEVYTALHPLDYHSPDQRDRIRKIIQGT